MESLIRKIISSLGCHPLVEKVFSGLWSLKTAGAFDLVSTIANTNKPAQALNETSEFFFN